MRMLKRMQSRDYSIQNRKSRIGIHHWGKANSEPLSVSVASHIEAVATRQRFDLANHTESELGTSESIQEICRAHSHTSSGNGRLTTGFGINSR